MTIPRINHPVIKSSFSIFGLLLILFASVSLACGPSGINTTLPNDVSAEKPDTIEKRESTPTNTPDVQPVILEDAPTPTAERDSSAGEEEPIPTTTPETSTVVLVGMPSLALGQAAKTIQDQGGYTVSVNPPYFSTADLVLFTVYAPDGLMPPLLAAIENYVGQKMARTAVLLIGVDVLGDPELLELVKLDILEAMPRYFAADPSWKLEFLQMPDTELFSSIEALLILPEMGIQITAPNP